MVNEQATITPHAEGAHDDRLQSLRGLAALTVALGHSFTVPLAGRIESPDFHLRSSNAFLAAAELIFQPNTAVIVFYVLSGFVLAQSLRRRALPLDSQTAGFVVRRVGRMVPVMWLSILFAVAVFAFVDQRPFTGATPWFNTINMATPISFRAVLVNLAGIRSEINSPLWSVQIELTIAPFLPLLVRLADRLDARWIAPVFIGLCFASIQLWYVAPNAVLFAHSFYLGIALPKLLASPLFVSIARRPATLIIALIILVPVDWAYCTGRLWMPYKFFIDSVVSAEIIAFILLQPQGWLSRVLHSRPLVTLGNLSYSFYAFHMSVLLACAVALLSALPANAFTNDWVATAVTCVLAIGSIAIALALSALSYAAIEQRGTALGRRYGQRIERWWGRRSAVASP